MVAMHAIRHHAFGPPEVLALEDFPDPSPAPGQVLVAVTAHGVHLLDTTIRRGEAGGPLPLPDLPTIPGREIAGTVAAVGQGVPGSWVGRRVVAHLGPVRDGGGYARLAVVAADSLFALPDSLDAADAVAIIGTGRTTLMVLALVGGPAKVRAVRGLVPDAGEQLAVVDYRADTWDDAAGAALGRLTTP